MSNYLHTKALGEAIKKLYILGGKRYHPEKANDEIENAMGGITSKAFGAMQMKLKPNLPSYGNTEESFGSSNNQLPVGQYAGQNMMNPWLQKRATDALNNSQVSESATLAPVTGLNTPQGSEKRISDADGISQDINTSRKLMKYGTMLPQE